jgi:hypothetical protein
VGLFVCTFVVLRYRFFIDCHLDIAGVGDLAEQIRLNCRPYHFGDGRKDPADRVVCYRVLFGFGAGPILNKLTARAESAR